MSKQTVSALIKAIQESAALFVESGGTQRKRLISNESDSNYVQSLESDYSDEITEIVNNIPDDPEPPEPPVPTNYIEVLLALYFDPGYPVSQTFSPGGKWYAGIMSQEDEDRIHDFGVSTYNGDLKYGEVKYLPEEFSYEPLALYADAKGEELNTDDMTDFYCYTSGTSNRVLTIHSISGYYTPSKTWLCRITKLSE